MGPVGSKGMRMKRIGLINPAVALALLAVAAAVPLLVPEKTIRVAVAREIQVLTGRMPAIAGDAGLTILPYPSVSVERLSLPGLPEGSPLLQADPVDATLRLSSLLLGRIEIASVARRKARLDLSIDRAGKRSWGFTEGVLARAAKGDRSIELPLGSLRFIDGRVAYQDARSGARSEFVLADAGVNWSKLGRGMSASGV